VSKNGTKFPLDCPFKGNRQNVFKNLHFLSHNIDDRFSALIFTELNPNPHLESAFGMRIPDADPGDQNHADSCGCGSGTLVTKRDLAISETLFFGTFSHCGKFTFFCIITKFFFS
jgi:hypothetical protein